MGCGRRVASGELRVAGCGLRVAGCELRVVGCGLWVVGCELRVASCELRVASCELRVASCELRVAGCGLRVAGGGWRVAGGEWRVASCGLWEAGGGRRKAGERSWMRSSVIILRSVPSPRPHSEPKSVVQGPIMMVIRDGRAGPFPVLCSWFASPSPKNCPAIRKESGSSPNRAIHDRRPHSPFPIPHSPLPAPRDSPLATRHSPLATRHSPLTTHPLTHSPTHPTPSTPTAVGHDGPYRGDATGTAVRARSYRATRPMGR